MNGHPLCLLLPSLLTLSHKGRCYLSDPPFLNATQHPPAQQPSEHIAGPEGSAVDNLPRVHMAEQSARLMTGTLEPNRCVIHRP